MDSAATKILVVSMSTAAERRARFAARAAEAGLAWEFFDAWTSLHPDLRYDPNRLLNTHGRGLEPGEIGCYSSHFAIWQRLLEGDARQVIVLEDDVIVDWSLLSRLADVDLEADGIDYLRLYHKQPVPSLVRRHPFLMRDRRILELFGRAYGTQAYAITRAGAARMAEACRRVCRPIDDEMDRSWSHGIPNLALFPSAVLEEALGSHIGEKRFGTPRTGEAARRRARDSAAAGRAFRAAWLGQKLRRRARGAWSRLSKGKR